MAEDRVNKFIGCLVSTAKLMTGISDPFFVRKLYSNLSQFITEFKKDEGDLQSRETIISIDKMLEALDYAEYLKIVPPSPLFLTRKNFLRFKLDILRSVSEKKNAVDREARKEQVQKVLHKKNSNQFQARQSLSPMKERMLEFIKQTPSVRTKQVIEEFNLISERTVKRNLKELTDQGFIQRKEDSKAVHYSAEAN